MVRLIIEPRLQADLRKSCQLRLSAVGDELPAGNYEKTRVNADMGGLPHSVCAYPAFFSRCAVPVIEGDSISNVSAVVGIVPDLAAGLVYLKNRLTSVMTR